MLKRWAITYKVKDTQQWRRAVVVAPTALAAIQGLRASRSYAIVNAVAKEEAGR